MKPKDTIKQKNLESIKTERYPREEVLPEDDLHRYLHELGKKTQAS